ncbi:MAG: hypothetical protein DRR16_15365 [Candidatus Parabeggiatoa sp. nov. 3]|nr:MAG: hypothetical protein DRR00_20620 [Gammaproteobacteria bacterium]RKZ60179.1 MAG: hypothetical protein DRQ99_22515 [Gammaproteobacteria bacterium]RKZ84189.1 MAG: hypothetical protein DRR16_15365 [Gammaproteobacteria bacterium]
MKKNLKFTQKSREAVLLRAIIVLIGLFYWQSALAQDNQSLPITGSWQIIGYQIVDNNPTMSETEIKKWLGSVVQFTEQNKAILHDGLNQKVCPQFDFQITTENAEGYFLIGYQVNPHRLGITDEEIVVVSMACQVNSWLGKHRKFVIQTDEQLLSYWDGVIFFFVKQGSSANHLINQVCLETLLITPQSVGLLNSDSDFNEKTLLEALPGCTVELKTTTQITQAGDEQVKQYFELFRQNQSILKVYPDDALMKIARIRVFDDKAIAPAHAKLGTSYAKVFKNEGEIVDCQAGIKKRSGQTVCSFENMPSIQYVFEPSKQGVISPIEALNQAKLVEIIWISDRHLINEKVSPEPEPAPMIKRAAPITDTKGSKGNLKTAVTPMEMPIDVEKAYKIQDKRLQKLYNLIVIALTKETGLDKKNGEGENVNSEDKIRSKFINAQRAWIKYRDENCQWHSTLANSQNFTCLEQETRKRADEIEKTLKQLE